MGTAGVGLPSQIHSEREKQNEQPDFSLLREKDLGVLGQGKENTAHGRWPSEPSLLVSLSVPVDFGKFSTNMGKTEIFLVLSSFTLFPNLILQCQTRKHPVGNCEHLGPHWEGRSCLRPFAKIQALQVQGEQIIQGPQSWPTFKVRRLIT